MATLVSGPPPGLRERKKQQTREGISEAATRLFLERGFEATTIAEVARAAGVSKMTVTNYFPLKEDLVFDRAPMIVATPVRALENRPAGMSALSALKTAYLHLLDQRHPTLSVVGPRFAEMVRASPALQERERLMFDARERALAERLIIELGDADDLTAHLAAAHLDGVVRVLYEAARNRLLDGQAPDAIVAALRPRAEAAFDQLAAVLPPALVASG